MPVKWTWKRTLAAVCAGVCVAGCAAYWLGKSSDTIRSGVEVDALTAQQEENLYKLGKVWGYVKYHHPAVVSGEVDWDQALFDALPSVLEAASGEEANQALAQWLEEYPVPDTDGEEALQGIEGVEGVEIVVTPDNGWTQEQTWLGQEVSQYLTQLGEQPVEAGAEGYAAFTSEDPRVSFVRESTGTFDPRDDGVKLLGLFRFWNAFQYFSPYVSLTDQDWDTVLQEGIRPMVEAETIKDYLLALAQVTAQTGDNHVYLLESYGAWTNQYGDYYLPCRLTLAEGQLVVAQTDGEDTGLQRGDVLVEVDGTTIEQRLTQLRRYFVFSREDAYLNQIEYQLVQTKESTAQVTVLRDGAEVELQVDTTKEPYEGENPYETGVLEGENIGYLDPSTLTSQEQLEEWMGQVQDTDGLILDLRYYPGVPVGYTLGEFLIPQPTEFARLALSDPTTPGQFYVQEGAYCCGKGWMAQTGQGNQEYPAYSGKVVILMDQRSQSQSEFTTMALRQAPQAVVLGTPSVGADGDIARLPLPGGVVVTFSGLGVYTPEGEQTQRVGVQPDVWCEPTLDGIREGRDELVEQAIAIIQGDTQ